MVRVRRVSGLHRPSPFTKGGGVGEGDSTPWPGHAARPLGPRAFTTTRALLRRG